MRSITTTGFRTVPPRARGLVRDLRVRWAARESGQPYDLALIAFEDRISPQYLADHPFGQVPIAKIDGETVFESGAILYALGLNSPVLLSEDPKDRLRTLSWMFAALNTVEPPIVILFTLDILSANAERSTEVRDSTVGSIRYRLAQLADALGSREYLVGRFSIADIIMATTLRFLRHTELVAEQPVVSAYLARCEARPAFLAALAEQEGNYAEADALAA
ncbi:glutathione S-transferase family protein [Sphingomonas sp. ASY06-1R]|uniref:glutathione S-transferase family protein n=1 Tax=Sphingomonas sp. ASY06-1R TaxID=3445771 RepID=UPI003FA33ECC